MRYIHIEVSSSDDGNRVLMVHERDTLDELAREVSETIYLDAEDGLELTLDVALSETKVVEARIS